MPSTTPNHPVNVELLTRSAEYVRGWFGVDIEAVRSGAQEQPAIVPELYSQLHNLLHLKQNISDETISAYGFRLISKATATVEAESVPANRQLVSLVPRHYRTLSPQELEQREKAHELQQDFEDFETIFGVKV